MPKYVPAIGLLVLVLLCSGCPTRDQDRVRTFELTSRSYKVEGDYTSMAGPSEDLAVKIDHGRELIWIVGYEAELLQDDGRPAPERFMCHASLDLSKDDYAARMAPRVEAAYRLFTVSQGVTRVDFPQGFGLPMPSDQLLQVRTQILNLNSEKPEEEMRFRIRIRYIRNRDLTEPMKPLFLIRVPVVKAVDPEAVHFGGVVSEAACSVGVNANPENYLEYDSEGHAFIPHWKVSPGRETTKTLVTERLALPGDLRIHTIVTHVHPTAESLTLVDLTTMNPVFRADVKPLEDKLGITKVDTYSSVEGLPLHEDHDYGLVSVYDNHTDRMLDSMAVMYLYVHDPGYIPPGTLEAGLPLPPETRVVQREQNLTEFESRLHPDMVEVFFDASLGSDWGKAGPKEWVHNLATLHLERGSGAGSRFTLKLK